MAGKKEEVKESKPEEIKPVEVEQNVEKPAATSTLYFNGYVVVFENGKAKVDAALAKELKKANYVK